MSILSANTLFHFTSEFTWLAGILEKGFIPRYGKEFYTGNNVWGKGDKGHYIPMVCFCDLPLSQLKDHIGIYGQYGIGLEKEWGMAEGLSPVYYLTEESQFIKDFKTVLHGSVDLVADLVFLIQNGRPRQEGEQPHLGYNEKPDDFVYLAMQIEHKFLDLYQFDRFFKPYSGRFEKGVNTYENYCYYNEREWRYNPIYKLKENLSVPEFVLERLAGSRSEDIKEAIKKNLEWQLEEGLSDSERFYGRFAPGTFGVLVPELAEELKNKYNQFLERSPHYHLSFGLANVKYIILKDDLEISNLITLIRGLQSSQPDKYTDEAINLLSTKIITCKQINEDF